jgi:hypothetical protein
MQPRASAASVPSAQSCRAQLVELIKHENKIIERQQNFTKRPGPASLRQSSHAKDETEAPFRWQKFWREISIALSLLFGKIYPIID